MTRREREAAVQTSWTGADACVWDNSYNQPKTVIAMYTLGISCYYHDSAAALLKNGEVMAAAQEERLGGLVIFTQGSVVAPFIYSLF